MGTVAEVRKILQAFCRNSRHEFCPDDVSLIDTVDLIVTESLTSSAITDVYLLLLARKHQAKLATFDSRIPWKAIADGQQAFHLVGRK